MSGSSLSKQHKLDKHIRENSKMRNLIARAALAVQEMEAKIEELEGKLLASRNEVRRLKREETREQIREDKRNRYTVFLLNLNIDNTSISSKP